MVSEPKSGDSAGISPEMAVTFPGLGSEVWEQRQRPRANLIAIRLSRQLIGPERSDYTRSKRLGPTLR